MDRITEIRQRYGLIDIIERYTGAQVRGNIVCPFPDHHHSQYTASFTTFNDGIDKFICYGNCGHSGDVIDFVGFMTIPGYTKTNGAHVTAAMDQIELRPAAPRTRIPQKVRPALNQATASALVGTWSRSLDYHARYYLDMRGVLDVAERFKLGYSYVDPKYVGYKAKGCKLPGHYITIPTLKGEHIVGVKFRRIDTHPDYAGESNLPLRYDSLAGKTIGKSQIGLFNYNKVAFTTEVVFSPEGEFDVLLAEALGFNAACLNGGAGSKHDDLLVLAHAKNIILSDPDAVGIKHAESKSKNLNNSRVVRMPYGDLGAMFLERGEDYTMEFLSELRDQREAP